MAEKGMSLRKQAFAPWGPRRWTRYVKLKTVTFSGMHHKASVLIRGSVVVYSGSWVYSVLMSALWNESVLCLVTSNKRFFFFFSETIPASVTVNKAVPSTGLGFLISSTLASSQERRNGEIFLSAERFKARLKCALDRLH